MRIKTNLFYLSVELFMIFDEFQVKTTDFRFISILLQLYLGIKRSCFVYFILIYLLNSCTLRLNNYSLTSSVNFFLSKHHRQKKEREKKEKMSYFPNFLELQRSSSYMEKNDCQLPRNTMNELVMNYLVTG